MCLDIHPKITVLLESEASTKKNQHLPIKGWLRVRCLRTEMEKAQYFPIEYFRYDQDIISYLTGISGFIKKSYWAPIKIYEEGQERTVLIDRDSAIHCLMELGCTLTEAELFLQSGIFLENIVEIKIHDLMKSKNLSHQQAIEVFHLFESSDELSIDHAINIVKVSDGLHLSLEQSKQIFEFAQREGMPTHLQGLINAGNELFHLKQTG